MQTITSKQSVTLDGRGPGGVYSLDVKLAYHWHRTWTGVGYIWAKDIVFGSMPDLVFLAISSNVDMELTVEGVGWPTTILAGIPLVWHTGILDYYAKPFTTMTANYFKFRNQVADLTKEVEVILGFNPDIG